MSETAKVRELPQVMEYVIGDILDVGCGTDKLVPEAIGFDGRKLPGVDLVGEYESLFDLLIDLRGEACQSFDTVFSAHFLEHCSNQFDVIDDIAFVLKSGGHLILYLPDRNHYNNSENEEHMIDMNYTDFMFWFRRSFCGEGKNFKGEYLRKVFEVVDSGMDVGDDRYSFFVVAKKI